LSNVKRLLLLLSNAAVDVNVRNRFLSPVLYGYLHLFMPVNVLFRGVAMNFK